MNSPPVPNDIDFLQKWYEYSISLSIRKSYSVLVQSTLFFKAQNRHELVTFLMGTKSRISFPSHFMRSWRENSSDWKSERWCESSRGWKKGGKGREEKGRTANGRKDREREKIFPGLWDGETWGKLFPSFRKQDELSSDLWKSVRGAIFESRGFRKRFHRPR